MKRENIVITRMIMVKSHLPSISITVVDCLVDYSSESDDLEDARDKVYWDKYDTVMKKFDPIPAGVRGTVPDIKDIVIIDVLDNKTKLIIKEMMRNQSIVTAKIIARGKYSRSCYI